MLGTLAQFAGVESGVVRGLDRGLGAPSTRFSERIKCWVCRSAPMRPSWQGRACRRWCSGRGILPKRTRDEWVLLDEVEQASEILYRFALLP